MYIWPQVYISRIHARMSVYERDKHVKPTTVERTTVLPKTFTTMLTVFWRFNRIVSVAKCEYHTLYLSSLISCDNILYYYLVARFKGALKIKRHFV